MSVLLSEVRINKTEFKSFVSISSDAECRTRYGHLVSTFDFLRKCQYNDRFTDSYLCSAVLKFGWQTEANRRELVQTFVG